MDEKTNTELTAEWFKHIDNSLQHEKSWRETGESIVKRYRAEYSVEDEIELSFYNVLYSNTETLAPVLFSRVPEAIARRRNNDSDTARDVSELIERAINFSTDEFKFESECMAAVQDYQLPGRGQMKILIEPVIESIEVVTVVEPVMVSEAVIDAETGETLEAAVFEAPERAEHDEETGELVIKETKEDLVFQEGKAVYYAWDQWTHSIAKKWRNVTWVAFNDAMDKDAIIEKFGKKLAEIIPYNAEIELNKTGQSVNQEDLAEVWEVWDKQKRERFYIIRGYEKMIDSEGKEGIDEDPMSLDGFFPCPEPLYSITTNDTLVPVPFFKEYEDQANQVDSLTTRIARLTDNLKLVGAFDASQPLLQDIMSGFDGDLIPIEDFSKITEKGGLNALVAFIDMQPLVNVIISLEQEREKELQIIHDTIGISDIMRGQTDPQETATAQRIKGNFGTIRVSKQQREVQRFIRDVYEILGEALVENVEPEVLSLMTGIDVTPEMSKLMKNQVPRTFAIDVETDSTIVADEIAEQQEAREVIGAITEFMQIAPQMVQAIGDEATVEVFMSSFRKFRAGRNLEDVILKGIKDAKEAAKNAPEPPNPELIKAQNETAKIELETQKAQAQGQLDVARLNIEQQKLDLEAGKAVSEAQRATTENALDAAKLQLEAFKVEIEAKDPSKNVVVGV